MIYVHRIFIQFSTKDLLDNWMSQLKIFQILMGQEKKDLIIFLDGADKKNIDMILLIFYNFMIRFLFLIRKNDFSLLFIIIVKYEQKR